MNKIIRAFPWMLLAAAAFFAVSIHASCKREANPYRDAAVRAAAWIRASGIRTGEGLAWPAVPGEADSVAVNLYSGTPGVILFFLQSYRATGREDDLRDASAGADFLLAKMTGVEGEGLYEGLSGVAFALEEAYRASRDEKYRRGFLSCLDRIRASAVAAGEGIEWSTTTDIISGGAGTGLFLIYAYHATGDRAWLDLASQAGLRLIELGRPEGGGLKWAMDPAFPRLMPNFSHGTAGIAYFLASLFKETKEPAFLDAALAGGKYLTSIAETGGDACLIFHDEPDHKDLYYLGWCHGPVGTARLFYLLSQVSGDPSWLDWVRRCANGLLQSGLPEKETPGFWNNAGICCGLAGVGEFFLDLHGALGDPSYMAFAERVAARLMTKATREDGTMFWIQAEHRTRPDYLFAQTGYMQGAAGIGTFLLRLAAAGGTMKERIVFPDTPFLR